MADDAVLDQIEREEFDIVIAPPPRPRELVPFVSMLFLPPGGPKRPTEADPPVLYDPFGHPIQLLILRELASGRWRKFVIVACTQDGKSWLIQVLVFWVTCELREPMVYGAPDLRTAQDAWLQKIEPALRASGLDSFMPRRGTGSEGGSNVTTVALNGGGLLIFLGAGGKNGSGQASRTSRWVVVDEFGKIKKELTGKFDARADSFDSEGRIVKAGTVEADVDDTLLEEYELGSRSRGQVRCHLCGEYTVLDWEQVEANYETERTAAQSVRIHCARCKGAWTDEERKANLVTMVLVHAGQQVRRDGGIEGDQPGTFTCSVMWGALESPLKSLGVLAVKYGAAILRYERGNAQPLIDFYHDQLARVAPIKDGREEIHQKDLAARSAGSDYQVVRLGEDQWVFMAAMLPRGVAYLTAAIDQSLRRLWFVLRGHDLEGRTWTLGWGRIPLCMDLETPNKAQRHAGLDTIRDLLWRGLPQVRGEVMKPVVCGVDVSEFQSETVDWLVANPNCIALRGTGATQVRGMTQGSGKEVVTEPGWYQVREYERAAGDRFEIVWIDSDSVKTELHRALKREPGTTAAAHLPRGLDPDDEFTLQMTAEKFMKTPGGRWTWVHQGHPRNDLWDGHYYTQALGKFVRDRFPELVSPPTEGKRPRGGDDERRGEDFGGLLGGW
jgi:phage terminase large subunit GpA-like protein